VSVALHLAAVDVTLNDVRLEPLLGQDLVDLPGDHVGPRVPGVGQGGVLGRALAGFNQMSSFTQQVPGRGRVTANCASMGDADHQVGVAPGPGHHGHLAGGVGVVQVTDQVSQLRFVSGVHYSSKFRLECFHLCNCVRGG